MAGRVEIGWYRLPRSGQPYHGPIPPGADEIDAPGLTSAVVLARPAKGDTKSDWVAYAVQEGLDVDGLTKTEIVTEIEALEKRIDAIENGESVPVPVPGVELGADAEQPGAVPRHQEEGT